MDTASGVMGSGTGTPAAREGNLPFVKGRLSGVLHRRVGLALWLWGEAGIGKTHTALAALRDLPCRSLSLPANTPLGELVRRLPRPARLPLWVRGALDRIQAGTPPDSAGVVNAVAATLAGLAPFVLHLEDLHEADPARHGLVTALALLVARTPGVGLLVTSRTSPPAGFQPRHHDPLDAPGSAVLLETEAGAPLPAEALAWIYERASGHPLFSLEYFRLLARLGHLWNDTRRWRWRAPTNNPVPVTVEALIEQVLREVTGPGPLGEAAGAQAMLPAAPAALLAVIAGLSPEGLLGAQADLERMGVLSRGQFAHPLYREMVLRHLGRDRRLGLARRALAALTDQPQLAADFAEEAQLPRPEMLALLERAAAETRHDPGRAARFLARAAGCTEGTRRAELALQAARGLGQTDRTEALRLTELALATEPANAEAITLHSELLASLGRLPEAEATLTRLPEAEQTGPGWTLRRIGLRGAAHDHAGVLRLWQAHPYLWPLAGAAVVARVAFALARQGEIAAAGLLAEAALKTTQTEAEQAPETTCELFNVLGMVCYGRGDYAGAHSWYSRELQLAREARLPEAMTVALVNRGMALGELCRNRERVADLEACLAIHTELGHGLQATRAQVAVADARLDMGEYERAEDLLLECRSTLSQLGPSDHLIECEYRLSSLYRDWAPPHGGVLALRHAHAALGYARELGGRGKLAWSLCYAAIAEARFGDATRAARLASEALAVAEGLGSPGQVGMARLAQAHALEAAGQRAEALETFTAVEASLHQQGLYDAAHEVGMEVDRLTGDAARAAERLAWFEGREMTNLANLIRRAFPGLSPATGPARPGTRPAHHLHLEVLGGMRLGTADTVQPVRGRRRRELLAALLEAQLRGRSEVTRLDLLDSLYSGTDEGQASASLKELVHQTRAALGQAVIRTTPGGYALGDVTSDAARFLESGDTRLWRGPYLHDTPRSPHDETVTEALHLALREAAGAALDRDPREAARVARLLSENEPYDLGLLALMLRALRASGNHRSLQRVYQDARVRLSEVGETLPADWAEFLRQPVSLPA